MRVFVLLFNVGTDNEGLHSISVGDRNIVLMFEDEDDAARCALMLEAQDFPAPSVEAIDEEEIKGFCEESGYDCQLIQAGQLFIPPDTNVEQTDWRVDQDPKVRQGDRSGDRQSDRMEAPSEFASDELDAIRRRLEGLL